MNIESTMQKKPLLQGKYKDIFMYVVPMLGVLIFWQLVALNSVALPTPISVAKKIIYMMGNEVADKMLYDHIGASMYRMLIGLVIGVGLGIPVGIFMGWSRLFEAIVGPLFEIFRMIPSMAWIPLSILFFGTSEMGKIYIIIIAAFPPAVLNSWRGVRLVDPDMVTAAKILGADNVTIMRSVIFPAALPSIFAGVQYSVSISWMCILAAELVAAGEGLGYITYYGMEVADNAMIGAGMIVIGLVGFAISRVLKGLEGVIAPWN